MTAGHPHETARDLMTEGVRCIEAHETLDRAAQIMREEGVGALPICQGDSGPQGIITDRDIVIECISHGKDPAQMTAGDLARGVVSVEEDASVDDVLATMTQDRIRRLPVTSDQRVVGMISEADIARHLEDDQLARFVHGVYA